jgi:hypothetical protein
MKNIFYSILVVAGVIFVVSSCSNGAYNTNPNSNQNQSINPLKPLTLSQFNWGGGAPVSGDINGNHWQADTAFFGTDSSGASVLIAYKMNSHHAITSMMTFHLNIYKIETGSLFNMGFHKYDQWASYWDSSTTHGRVSLSYLGNSGEIDVTENDSAFLNAKFYFQGVAPDTSLLNVLNGNINFAKLH